MLLDGAGGRGVLLQMGAWLEWLSRAAAGRCSGPESMAGWVGQGLVQLDSKTAGWPGWGLWLWEQQVNHPVRGWGTASWPWGVEANGVRGLQARVGVFACPESQPKAGPRLHVQRSWHSSGVCGVAAHAHRRSSARTHSQALDSKPVQGVLMPHDVCPGQQKPKSQTPNPKP